MKPLEEAVTAGSDALRQAVFGTTDPTAAAGLVDSCCRRGLGAAPVGCVFSVASVGSVLGLRLADGREVVLKGHQAHTSPRFLGAVVRAQRHLADAGFPCPRPLADPAPLGPGWATVEELVADPGPWRPDAPTRRGSAAGLARSIALAGPLDDVVGLDGHPMSGPPEALWPRPHSPLFDFAATEQGAEAIDDAGRAARQVLDAVTEPPVVAHGDWSARNVRLDGERLVVAYDWDSLARVAESTAVGRAAATWSATAEPDDPGPPSPEEVAAYLADYELARGAPLEETARKAVGAAALYTLAYTARCEHALAFHGRAAPHHTRGRIALARHGSGYLDVTSFLS